MQSFLAGTSPATPYVVGHGVTSLHPVNIYHRTVSYGDLEAIAQLVHTEEEKTRIRQVTNELARNTMRGGLSSHWWLPLESISYTALDESLEDGAEKLYVNEVACESHHQVE